MTDHADNEGPLRPLRGNRLKGTAAPVSPAPKEQNHSRGVDPSAKGRIGWIVAGSLVGGLVAAFLLASAPVTPATESGVTGAMLLGLALGWALLAVLSVWFTAQPQKWAVAPALFMGLGGLLLLVFGPPVQDVLAWVWPPAMLVLVAWMVVKARQLRSRSGRLMLYPALAILLLASLGSGYAMVREAVVEGASPAQGRMIDVGGHGLYLECTGSGSPTVVLEPGAGLTSSDLAFVAPLVDRNTRVCTYDRAGHGWSDSTDTGQDGTKIATDLHTLLQRGNEPGPYVLAGHSFGGLYALTFAALYPDDVAGLVLVDSTAPASNPGRDPMRPTSADADTRNRVSALGAAAARSGLGLLVGVESFSHLASTIDEYLLAGDFAQQAAALTSFADKPLVVLTAGSGSQPGWNASQDALALLSTNSLHRFVDGATHSSMIADPEDAAATAQGILDAVSAVRTATPLLP